MTTIRQKTISGFKWVAFSRYAQKGISVLTFIILARLLEPSTFGLFAMAFIVINGLGMFKNLGIDSAYVQRKENVEVASHTAFWMMPFLGVVIFSILYFIAPMAALILKEPELTSIIRALGIIFVLGAMENIPASTLNKELKFKQLSLRELLSSILFSISAVLFAFLKFGVWSLVYAYLIKRVSMFIFSWTLSPYRPKLIFDKKIANELLHFGKFIFSTSLISFLIVNTDNFLVGKLMGAASLGYYALAYNLSSMTTSHLSGLVNRVIFPVYSKMQDTKEEIKNMSLKLMRVISFFSFPFGIGLILFSSEVIGAVYGTKWLPMVPALKVLALCSMFLPIGGLSQSVFIACGKPKWAFFLRIPVIAGMVILIPLLSKDLGLTGVGMAVAFSKLCIIPVSIILLNKMINLGYKDLYENLKMIILASIIMIITGVLLKLLMRDIIGEFSFIVYGSMTLMAYVLCVYRLDNGLFKLIKRHLFTFKRPAVIVEEAYQAQREL